MVENVVENFLVPGLLGMVLGVHLQAKDVAAKSVCARYCLTRIINLKLFLKRMSNHKMKGMFDILEEELRVLLEVVAKVDPQAASTFNRNLREQTQKLKKEDKKMMDAMKANTAQIEALLDEKEASLDRTEASLDKLKAALDMQQTSQDAREARIAQREAELGLSCIHKQTDMAHA